MSGSPLTSWPATGTVSLWAALTTWVSLWAWAGFVQSPSSYMGPAALVVLLVAASGASLRAARTPAPLVLAAQALLLLLWSTHQWAAEAALGGWLPTWDSLAAVGEVLRQSVASAQAYAAPVPDEAPSLAPLLVSVAAVVALLVDFLSCGLRRVPIAGLPLLAVYTAPVSILDQGVPWWVFAAGAMSFLWLLTSDESRRLRHWGRPVARTESLLLDGVGPGSSMGSTRSAAHKIGLTATGFAVVAPLVVPTFGQGLLSGTGSGSGGDGESVSISNPMVDLKRDLTRGRDIDLIAIHSEDDVPSYLRISVLDTFNGDAWRPSSRDIPPEQQAEGSLPPPAGLRASVEREEVEYRLSISDGFASTWLPAPYPVSRIDVPGDWRYDTDTLDFISAVEEQTTAGLDYALTALDVRPTTRQLLDSGATPEDVFTPFTELPDELPDSVAALASGLTDHLETRFEKAVRLQRWFREDGGFTYSLRRDPGNGTDDLVAFVSDEPGGRVGYCEQFAAAMAVMGRTLGIPSRVAVGFLRPDRVSADTYVFSAHDLHAWPEMYFDDVGWVRFEPTPSTRAPAVPGYTTGSFRAPEPTDLPSAGAEPTERPRDATRGLRETDLTAPAAGGNGGGGTGSLTAALVVLVLGLSLLVAPRLLRALVRRRRWTGATTPAAVAEAGWRELRDSALDLGHGWDDTATLRTRARSLAAAFGGAGRVDAAVLRRGLHAVDSDATATVALWRLVEDVEAARYARDHRRVDGRPREEVEADVATCVTALEEVASVKRRRRARWLPASLLRNGALASLRAAKGSSGMTLSEPGVDRAT